MIVGLFFLITDNRERLSITISDWYRVLKTGRLLSEIEFNWYHDFLEEETQNENYKTRSTTNLFLLTNSYR